MRKRYSLRTATRTLSCPCGAPIIVDGRRPVGTQECIVCHQQLKTVITTDPRTRKRTVGIIVSTEAVTVKAEAVKPKPGSKRAKTRVLSGAHNPRCACGARVPVDLSAMDAVHTCTWCGASYTAVAKDGVALLMPVEAAPVEKPKAGGAFALSPELIGAQPVRTRAGGVWISCFCGRELPVESEAARQNQRCPGCGLAFQLVLAVEPGTHRAMAITLPRTKAASKTRTA